MTVTTALESSEMFIGLPAAHLEKLAALFHSKSYRKDDVIFKEGDEATHFYLLSSGQVALEMEIHPVPNRPSIPTALEVCTKGEPLGWSALVEPYTYTLSGRCLSSCTVLAAKGDMLRKLLSEDTALGYEFMARLAQVISLRLTHTRLRIVSGVGLSMLERDISIRPE